MGCDIHGYVDYDLPYPSGIYTRHLASVSISRDYWLFTLLAGVRGESIQGQEPISEAKGLPERMSWRVEHEAYMIVLDQEETEEYHCCTRKDAEKWGSHYTDASKKYIHHPDWHSHSWLSLEEVEEVVRRYSLLKNQEKDLLEVGKPLPEGHVVLKEFTGGDYLIAKESPIQVPVELLAIRDMMKTVEAAGYKSRFIFWFDN